MTDASKDSECSFPTPTTQVRWIELSALQRDLLELFYRHDRRNEAAEIGLTDAVIADELAEWYGDVVLADAIETALADLADRSLLTTQIPPESDREGLQYTLTSTGQVLFSGRVVSLANLLTDEVADGDGTAGDTEGKL